MRSRNHDHSRFVKKLIENLDIIVERRRGSVGKTVALTAEGLRFEGLRSEVLPNMFGKTFSNCKFKI